MPQLTVVCKDAQRSVATQVGESILSALQHAGLRAPESPCGGKGTCKKCTVMVDGQLVLACQTRVSGDHTVIIPEQNDAVVIAAKGEGLDFSLTEGEGLGLAVDIGTTTIVAHLYDLKTGALLGTHSGMNAQRTYGADVISRICYANEHDGGLAQLTAAIRTQLEEYLRQLCVEAGRAVEEVKTMVIAANTVMEHLYAGLSPETIAVAPFTPLSLFGTWESGETYGLNPAAKVYLTPAVAGYVGGDITVGLLSGDAWCSEENVLFLDIGTNGEMALGNAAEGFLCCATAAGPAFEGACISQGMSAQNGAISAVDWKDGEVRVSVIGGGKAEGICGSGLVDALAVMLEIGAVDETGRLLPDDEAEDAAVPYLDEGDEGVRFRLAEDVYITAADVRQLQLAKAAIAAGIQTLLEEVGLEEKDVSRLFLAGGFGNYIRKESACAIGLLPPSMEGRILSVGNSAGQGASAVLLSEAARTALNEVKVKCRYLELSGHKGFNDNYIECMMFE